MAARAVQVCMLAQQALEAIAGKLPRQPAFRTLVDALRQEQQDGMGEAPTVQVYTAAPPDTQASQACSGLREPPFSSRNCSGPRCHAIAAAQLSTAACLASSDGCAVSLVQALLQCCAALVRSMGKAEADAALQGPLMPALVAAFQHSCADVRKSVSSLPRAHLKCAAQLSGTLCPSLQRSRAAFRLVGCPQALHARRCPAFDAHAHA